MIAATIVCVIACSVLVAAERRQWRRVRASAKTIASLAFIAVGVLGMFDGGPSPTHELARYRDAILAGLVLGFVGDVALLGGKRAFTVGLVAFLLGHVAYIVAFAQFQHRVGIEMLAPVIAGGCALALLWKHLGSMRVPVIAYVVTIVAMVIAALGMHSVFPIVGASLFFVSDLAVARDRFVARTFANKAWGLPTYYAGQLVIAWSYVVI